MVKSELDTTGTKQASGNPVEELLAKLTRLSTQQASGQASKDVVRERKLARIVAAVKRAKAKGRKLFAVNDPTGGDDYYKTELGAKRATRSEQAVYDEEGCLLRVLTVYPDIDEIDLRHIVGWLKNRENPFMSLSHSYSAYPYKWLKDIEELFRVDGEYVEKL